MTIERYLRLIAGAFILVFAGTWTLGEPVLVSLHRLCGFEPVSVSIYQLVPMMTFLRKLGVSE